MDPAPRPPALALGPGRRAWALNDGSTKAEAAGFALGAEPAALAAALGDALLPDGRFSLSIGALLLDWDGERILVDTGCGPAFGPTLDKLPERLKEAGFSPEDVTAIVFTHLHLDHTGGALDDGRGGLRYPRARLLAPRAEVAFWSQAEPDLSRTSAPPERRAAMIRGTHHALGVFGSRLGCFEPGDALFGGIKAEGLPGHTPGHCGLRLSGDRTELWAIGDALTDQRIACALPRCNQSGDVLPDQAGATRLALLDWAAREGKPLFGCHFPLPGFIRVARDAAGFRWEPATGVE